MKGKTVEHTDTGRTAFVFAGQGDQFPGMGNALLETSPEARQVLARCEAVRPGTEAQIRRGPKEALDRTESTQPCLYTLEMAMAEALSARGIVPFAAAGFSLGEVCAVAYAGALSLEDGMRLVCRRGLLMQEASDAQDTFMAAVLRLSGEETAQICAGLREVYAVNFNAPGQTTVAGRFDQKEALAERVRQAGGRLVPVAVSAGFHSPFMARAAAEFSEELQKYEFQQMRIPVYTDVTGERYDESPRTVLAAQIASPVYWEKLIRNLIADGAERFIEIGPGHTLTNMIRRIDPSVEAVTAMQVLDPYPHEIAFGNQRHHPTK